MLTTISKHEVTELLHGPSGQLEAAIIRAEDGENKPWGIVCHPHPLYGGTMDNKIVTTIVRAFQHFKLNTIRFNFRGVGRSEGLFDEGNGELNDLLSVIDWIRQQKTEPDIWLGGFSFGAYIAAKGATLIDAKKLVMIAPPVVHFPMQTLPAIKCDWVLAQGMQDDVVSPEAVLTWATSRTPAPQILQFPEAGHYFHGQLTELRLKLEEALG